MNENNTEQEQPLYKEQPWWVQIFVALYAMFWLTMIFAAGLNSLYIGKIDIDSVSMAVIGGMVMIVVAGILASYFTRQEKQRALEEAKHTPEGLQRHLRHKEARDH